MASRRDFRVIRSHRNSADQLFSNEPESSCIPTGSVHLVGNHTLVVQAQVSTDNTSVFSNTNGGVSISNALFGLGSLTVEAVRLVNSFNCTADSTGALSCGG